MALKLGELLKEQGIISADQLRYKALEQQKAQGEAKKKWIRYEKAKI